VPICIAFEVPSGQAPWVTAHPDLRPLVGCIVNQVSFDFRVTLNLVSQDGAYGERVDAFLVIGNDFTLRGPEGAAVVSPDSKSGYEAVMPVLHSTLEGADIREDSALDLRFSNGMELRVPRDRHYESWSLSGVGVADWIATPE